MVHAETCQEEWVAIGSDEDGTEAFLDESAIVRDFEAALFTAWVKHVPVQGSRTYEELQHALSGARKFGTSPHHVKQLVEIDLAKRLSRTLSLVVCDKLDTILDTISFRFPEWTEIQEDSIMDFVRGSIAERFPDDSDATERVEPLKFSAPKAAPKPERVEISKTLKDAPPDSVDTLKLEQVDV